MKDKSPSRISFKSIARNSVPPTSTLLLALAAFNANAQSLYFVGPAGGIASAGSYSWDDTTSWGATSGTTPGAGGSWASGDFARFYAGGSLSYAVTVNADEQNTGLYYNATGTLTINSAGVGDDLDVTGGVPQGYLVASGGSLVINSPIVGNGGVAPELTGSLYLYGNNTYSGGTALGDSGNTLTYFNSANSFSTGPITLNRTANFSTLLSSGGVPIALANAFSTVQANTGTSTDLNFANAANTPVTSSGSWTLGAVSLGLRNNGNSTAPLTLSGAISGTSSIIFSGANGGTTHITGSSANNSGFTGTATIGGGAGENAITVSFGALNTFGSITGLTLAGGTLTAGGFSQAMTGAPLTLSASSVIMFGAPASVSLKFGNSSATTWSGILNVADWAGNSVADGGTSTDTLQIGTGSSGLTAGQLADIEVNGNASTLGEVELDANGNVEVVPEPSTMVLGVIGGMTMIGLLRRRAA